MAHTNSPDLALLLRAHGYLVAIVHGEPAAVVLSHDDGAPLAAHDHYSVQGTIRAWANATGCSADVIRLGRCIIRIEVGS